MAVDEYKLLSGAWLDAIGTIVSAIAEGRELAGIQNSNELLVTIGEGLQAVGSLLIGTVATDNVLDFTGNWIDGVGASASSLGAYLQAFDENGDDNIRLEALGDTFQSMGSSISAAADHFEGEHDYAIGNATQALGAGLEAIAGVFRLNERGEEAQPISTIGAVLQAIGSNFNAILYTNELREQQLL
ncbi:DUF6944 family repetitive protein [Desertibacillus haloalkaliphilus]|uniref:DUF6944 family repetitive protein n=1 Tax=Desertibacillus haloalkaliphilus TaxID=1328930 RepID=UPI001C274A21|nr:hypothetical protein [Desertibacillus haloalkaliphilus]MBU8908846.1 hypothetical protein [Desertibacillus haloalkaliphilus]